MQNTYSFAIGALSMLVARAAGASFWVGILLGALVVTAVVAIRDKS